MIKEKFERYSFEKSVIDVKRVDLNEVFEKKHPIIFDTNFLFVPFEFRIDVISDIQRLVSSNYSLFILEGTLDELKAVERKGDKNKKFLPLITTMFKKYDFKIIKSDEKYVDNVLIKTDLQNILIATNDKALRLKLWEKKQRVMYMRQTSYLEIK